MKRVMLGRKNDFHFGQMCYIFRSDFYPPALPGFEDLGSLKKKKKCSMMKASPAFCKKSLLLGFKD